ncbi:hypothetical protein BDW62DRAFT_44278 [Aspergillus aurantiobrunneus]
MAHYLRWCFAHPAPYSGVCYSLLRVLACHCTVPAFHRIMLLGLDAMRYDALFERLKRGVHTYFAIMSLYDLLCYCSAPFVLLTLHRFIVFPLASLIPPGLLRTSA